LVCPKLKFCGTLHVAVVIGGFFTLIVIVVCGELRIYNDYLLGRCYWQLTTKN